jgi:hypothetical protein
MSLSLLSLDAIRHRIGVLSAQLGSSQIVLPTFGRSDQDGRPHIEVGHTYDWVVCERGSEFERRKTLELDELLYWTFQSATFSLAVEWEFRHRVPGQDSRRLLFQHQRELLGKLNPDWASRHDEELNAILRENPFNDAG